MEHDWEPDNGYSGMNQGVSEAVRDESGMVSGGPGGIRTPDLLNAIEARSQLRYRPTWTNLGSAAAQISHGEHAPNGFEDSTSSFRPTSCALRLARA